MSHPSTIGRYRIIGVLGMGGMGTVYEAEQDQPQRRVALKVIRPEFIIPDLVRRFSREADVLGRLQHPGIAQIYEAGTHEDAHGAQPFFAMELVKGEPLTDYATAHNLDSKQRLALFARICDAVHYAHRQGVIHRDLKPANILVDAEGQPKILDFGVALLTGSDVQATRQTSVGEVIGTLQYMSPEQVNADPVQIDSRSDVYSLGVVLYELMSGKLPYDLARKMIFEAARVIMIDDPEPLSVANRSLRGDIEIIVAKALEKERERRYSSADELASDVRRFLNDDPISARPASAMYQLRKFARRNRALVSGLGLAALILVAGTAVSTWQAVRATTAERLAETRRRLAVAAEQVAERQRAVADSAQRVADSARATAVSERAAATASAERATGEAAKAQAVNAFLQDMLASSDPSNARGKDLRVRDVLDQAAARVSTVDIARQPGVRAGIETTIGRTYYGLGLYEEARPHLDSAYAIQRRLSPTSVEAGVSAGDVGELLEASGDYDGALKWFSAALAVKRARLQPDDDQVTTTLQSLANARYQLGNNAEAEKLHREALRLTRLRHGNTGVEVADRLEQLGLFLMYTGHPDQAEPLLNESLGMFRRAYGENHPQVVSGLVALGDVQRGLHRLPESEATFQAALVSAHTVFGDSHPMIADVLGRQGAVLTDEGKVAEAESPLRQALTMRVALLGADHPDVQLARTELGRLLQMQQKYAEADSLFAAALASRRSQLGEMSPAVASSLTDLGYLAKLQFNWKEDEARYRAAIPIWQAARIEDAEIESRAELGFALAAQEKADEAESILNDVLTRRRALYGDSSWMVADAYEKLAPVAELRGDTAKALALSLSSLAIRRSVFGPRSNQVANQLPNIGYYKLAMGDTVSGIPYYREMHDILTGLRPPGDRDLLDAQRLLGLSLCATGAAAEGESLIRRALASAPTDSTQLILHRLRATLGFCLMREQHYAEAEPLLVSAEVSMAKLGSVPPILLAQTRQWLASLYAAWGKPADAAEWQTKAKAEH
jgi:tetratricopeptide (TPR) repeat protein